MLRNTASCTFKGTPARTARSYARFYCVLAITCLGILDIGNAYAADVPQNLTAKQYSQTAGEIFWDRVSGPVAGYAVTRNGIDLGVLDALSYYDNSLQSGTNYEYTVASVEADGTRSAPVAVVLNTAPAAPVVVPDLLTGLDVKVYSRTAAELFWDRASDPATRYEASFVQDDLIPLNSTSLFYDNLLPGRTYNFFIRAVNPLSGQVSELQKIAFRTLGTAAASQRLSPPSNVRETIYSSTAAEVFWDRVENNSPQYEISLNGALLNGGEPTYATSIYLDSLAPGSDNTISIVALDGRRQNRSTPVELSFTTQAGNVPTPEPPQTPVVDNSPITAASALSIARFVLNIINDHGHHRVKQALAEFRFVESATPLPGLTLLNSESFVEAGTRRFRIFYDCAEGGRFIHEPISNAFGDANLVFEDCALPGITRNGSVFIDFDGTYLEYDYDNYTQTQLAANPRENVTIELDGKAGKGSERTGLTASEAATDLNYTMLGRAGEQRVSDLRQIISADGLLPPPESFQTDFTVDGFWTKGRSLDVKTTNTFTAIDSSNSFYTSGVLRVTDKISPANYLELSADTGDSNTYQLSVTTGDANTSELLRWEDLKPLTLPCLVLSNDTNGPEGCR